MAEEIKKVDLLEGAENNPDNLLVVKNLKKYFPIKSSFFKMTVGNVKAVDGVSFAIKRGTTMGLVGESGCGKSTLAKTVMKLVTPERGEILFEGKNILSLNDFYKKVQIIFQNPYSSLNPKMKIGEILREPLEINTKLKKALFLGGK